MVLTVHLCMYTARGGGGNLHMSQYRDVPLFWVVFWGLLPDFWVPFWAIPGFLGILFLAIPGFLAII